MNGFLNLYKPQGMTSFEAVRKLKYLLKPDKIGHLGTLDPMAEGILPLAIGKCTRMIEFIDNKSKTYLTTMCLGGISDTQDQWGKINYNENVRHYDKDELEYVVMSFKGAIKQIPPMYSAVHHNGQRLYDLARKGIVVDREARDAFIYHIELLDVFDDERSFQNLSIRVTCSEGTYIRTLCNDIGEKLGSGAYMTSLIRESWGAFSIENAISIDEAVSNYKEHLISPLQILSGIPSLTISDEKLCEKILVGNPFEYRIPDLFNDEKKILLLNNASEILAIAEIELKNNDFWNVKPKKVFK